ncbi:Chromatin structure-remodeling complex protein rsc9 [Emydomyces testavorans]|uniref:Chromatin structure-remodeling complex protein rsc9 n=1 Tax=Emydomyces testavorans TaxID=2070801 RepID=A0AAF0DGF8_9EURO|nr:Chromatin structure-remodeling complex protein rsc9 [Emydomyces testavorans]
MAIDGAQLKADFLYFKSCLRSVHLQTGGEPNWSLGLSAGWSVGGRRINPHELLKAVAARGGYHRASLDKRNWWGAAKEAGIPEGLAGTLSYQVKKVYQERLLDLELLATGLVTVPAAGPAPPPSSSSAPSSSFPPPPPPPPPPQQPSPLPPSSPSPSLLFSPSLLLSPSSRMATPAAEAASETRGDSRSPTPDPGEPSIIIDRTGESKLPAFYATRLTAITDSLAQGGDIYHRSYMGVRSRIPEEVEAGLYHLVRASDVYQQTFLFEDYPFLLEALLQEVLNVGQIVYGISWEANYDYMYFDEEYKQNARFDDLCAEGTFDLLDRIRRLRIIFSDVDVRDDETETKLRMVNEAALILRNMCQVDINANFLDIVNLARDTATIVLNLPNFSIFTEVKNHMLEMVVEACLWWPLWKVDPLFITLLEYLHSNDRFQLLCALKALVMFSYELEGVKKFGLAKTTFETITRYLLLDNDPELVSAVLDLLYQYVCEPENVEFILNNFDLPTTLIPRLVTLLLYDAEPQHQVRVYGGEQICPPPSRIAIPPKRCVKDLLEYQEPERTSRWAQSVFVEDSEGEIAQRAVWVAYQQTFADSLSDRPALLAAPEFINTVTHAFAIARARVINEGENGQKFVIQGIRPREVSRDINGFPYWYCMWRVPKQPESSLGAPPPVSPPTADAGQGQASSMADGHNATMPRTQTTTAATSSNYRPPTVEDEPTEQQAPARVWERTTAPADFYTFGPPPAVRDPNFNKRLADETPVPGPQWLELSDLSLTTQTLDHPELEYCNRVWTDPEKFRKHVLCVHMGIRNATDGNWYPFDRFKKVPDPVCHWDKCEEFNTKVDDLNYIAAHVSGHLPPIIDMDNPPLERDRPFYYPKRFITWKFLATPYDPDTKEPYGIAYKSLLILRNILQNVPKYKPNGRFEGTESWGVALYYSQRAKLLELADTNPTLRKELFDFVNDIDNSRWGFVFEL